MNSLLNAYIQLAQSHTHQQQKLMQYEFVCVLWHCVAQIIHNFYRYTFEDPNVLNNEVHGIKSA